MQRRGRSRQVSLAALARQASEERQRAMMERLMILNSQSLPPTPSSTFSPATASTQEITSDKHEPARSESGDSVPVFKNAAGGAELSSNLVPADCHRPLRPLDIIDLTGPESASSSQAAHDMMTDLYTYIYPPSVSPSPIASAVVTPTLSESHASDSYFSPSSPEEWNTPPPSLTLLDQLHMAYALDDLPLAKILLLNITHGIQDITSRTDPRLDSVQPEDFDVAFLPRGGLMTPEDEVRLAEQQEKERKRLQKEAEERRRYREGIEREKREQEERERVEKEERERAERERAWESWVEGVWGNAKREMDELKQLRDLARTRREEAEKEKRQDDERRRVTTERRRSNPSTKGSVSIPRISYAHLPMTRPCASPLPSPTQPQLLYALPNIPKLSTVPRRIPRAADQHPCPLRKCTTPSSHSLGLGSLALESLNENSDVFPGPVSFREVITAMRGELFPVESPSLQLEKRDPSRNTLHGRTKSDDLDIGIMRQRSKTPNSLSHNYKSNSISSTSQQKRDAALLAELLARPSEQVGADRIQGRRADKGKRTVAAVGRVPLRTNSSVSVMTKSTCAACSSSLASPSVTSSSSSGVSRSGSWLSFISSSSVSSTSTQLTTPSASISGSPPSIKSSIRPGSVFSTWLKGVASSSSEEKCTCDLLDAPCTYSSSTGPGYRLIPVAKDESPLPLDCLSIVPMENKSLVGSHSRHSSSSPPLASSVATNPLLRSMNHLLDAAKNFQSAYMHATMFAAIASVPNVSAYGNDWDREYKNEQETKQSRAVENQVKHKLRPVGYRVEKVEVALIISAIKKGGQQPNDAERVTALSGFRPKIKFPELFPPDDSAQYIPLISPYPYNAEHPPQTILPNPLPFAIHFKPQPSLTGSPLRRWSTEQIHSRSSSKRRPGSPPRCGPNGFRQSRRSSSPPLASHPIPRPRFVGNPLYLRLKALENCTGVPVTDTQIVELHEEGVCIKSGMLSKEKVLGTAFEEVGRSRLCVDLVHIKAIRHRVTLPVNSPVPWWPRKDDSNNAQLRWEDGNVRRGRSVVKG